MTYLDHKNFGDLDHGLGGQTIHSWGAFTEARLAWLYGPLHRSERAAMTQADIAAWRRLGKRPAA